MVVIKKCSVSQMKSDPDFDELQNEYGLEVTKNFDLPSKPDAEMYQRLENAGVFHLWAAFIDNKMIGFITIIINTFPHFSMVLSSTESWFVKKSERRSGAGMKLLDVAKDYVEKMGGRGIIISAPVNGPLIEVMEKSDQYIETGKVFFRKLNYA